MVSHDCRTRQLSTGRTQLQCKTVEGPFAGIDRGFMLLTTRQAGNGYAIPVASIEKLEVRGPTRAAQHDRTGQGKRIANQAITGGVVGFAGSIALAFIGASMTSDCCGDDPGLKADR